MADLSRCFIWWAHTDSNRGPKDYELGANALRLVHPRSSLYILQRPRLLISLTIDHFLPSVVI